LLKREADRAAKAKPGEWAAWCEKEFPAHRNYGAECLMPPARMFAELFTQQSELAATAAVSLTLDEYFRFLARMPTPTPLEARYWAESLASRIKAAAAAGV